MVHLVAQVLVKLIGGGGAAIFVRGWDTPFSPLISSSKTATSSSSLASTISTGLAILVVGSACGGVGIGWGSQTTSIAKASLRMTSLGVLRGVYISYFPYLFEML
ncbi:hypothetical protein VNO80_15810 [Phaseolus coccineus]|uniref:Uncharacterized protein n=1 Tax=Phaseolus coccineus TaxID=3886 RepID=A0AAN9R250_PHACN